MGELIDEYSDKTFLMVQEIEEQAYNQGWYAGFAWGAALIFAFIVVLRSALSL